jgi:hypothetical protein
MKILLPHEQMQWHTKEKSNLVPKYFWLSHSFDTEVIKKFAITLFLSYASIAVNCDFINFVERKNCNSWQVPGGGTAALPVLRPIHPGAEAQAYVVGKLVPSNLCEVIKEDSSRSWLSLYATFSKIKRRFCKLSAHPELHCSEIDHTCLSTGFSECGHVN